MQEVSCNDCGCELEPVSDDFVPRMVCVSCNRRRRGREAISQCHRRDGKRESDPARERALDDSIRLAMHNRRLHREFFREVE